MNIQTVIDNLNRTISGKKMMMERYQEYQKDMSYPVANELTVELLRVNIKELECILNDLESCMGLMYE